MKLYDENGEFVGTVSDEAYEYTKDSIMPVSLHVTIPKAYVPSAGLYLMAIVSIAAVICGAYSCIGFPDSLSSDPMFGIAYSVKLGYIPLIAFLQLAVSAALIREDTVFYYAFLLRILLVLFSGMAYFFTTEWPPVIWGVSDSAAMFLTIVAYYRCTGKKGIKNMTYAFLPLFRLVFFIPFLIQSPTAGGYHLFISLPVYYIFEAWLLLELARDAKKGKRYESI